MLSDSSAPLWFDVKGAASSFADLFSYCLGATGTDVEKLGDKCSEIWFLQPCSSDVAQLLFPLRLLRRICKLEEAFSPI